jgi:ribbon-helix-helix CopG family protein
MIRSQIYLTAAERKKLHLLTTETGKSQSELIREAIDLYICSKYDQQKNKLFLIQKIKGLWNQRDNLPDLAQLRGEFDREQSEGKE